MRVRYPDDGKRRLPMKRAGCSEVPRPCPHVGCRYHLFLDVNPSTGNIKLIFPDLEPHQLEYSCALDLADRGGLVLEDVGGVMNLTRERIRMIELEARAKLERALTEAGVSFAELVPVERDDDPAEEWE